MLSSVVNVCGFFPPPFPADCREILLPLMTEQLKFHLEKREEPKACCQLLSDILEVLYRKDVVRNTTLELHVLLFSLWGKWQRNKGIQESPCHKEEAHLFDSIATNTCAVLNLFYCAACPERSTFYSTVNLLTRRVGCAR